MDYATLEDQNAPPVMALSPKGHPVLAWLVIVIACSVVVGLHLLGVKRLEPGEGDRLGVMLMEMQSKYMVGASQMDTSGRIYTAAEDALSKGGIPQRQRFVILAAELASAEEAASKLRELDQIIEREQAKLSADESLLTAEQWYVQHALHGLYLPKEEQSIAEWPETVRDELSQMGVQTGESVDIDQTFLIDELGWFGELALTHLNPDDATSRAQVMDPAKRLMYFFVTVAVVAGIAGMAGFAGLVLMVVLVFTRKVRSGMRRTVVHHGIYAETFAVWMVLFLLFSSAAGMVGAMVPDLAMLIVFIAFFSSLLALAWPVVRGVSWAQVRIDIGWTFNRSAIIETASGAGGYIMALPIFAVGIGITYILLRIQQTFETPGPIFEPSGGPAHPIIEQLGGPDWAPKIMVLMLAAIAAPVVEETMFRGVLYRHLRQAIATGGMIGSIFFSAIINSFIFAIIHPQGWVAVPALMSLAIAFSLVREWRGSVIPPMIMHAISNFLVMMIIITALSI